MVKAVRIHQTGGPEVMALEEVDLGPPGPGMVTVRHEAIGLNFIDTYHRSGLYPLELPTGIGLEAAGVIEAVGEGTDLAVGDRVAYCAAGFGAYSEAINLPAARLVTRAAVTEQNDGLVLIKVAKDTGGGVLGPLTGPELTGMAGYIDQIKFAGTRTSLISLAADLLLIDVEVFFNPLRLQADVQADIEARIAAYLTLGGFNGAVQVSQILDEIFAAEGVEDYTLNSIRHNDGAGYVVVTNKAVPLSGYFVIDPANPLSTTLKN